MAENILAAPDTSPGAIPKKVGDLDLETLSYIKTKSGDTYFEDADGQPWR